MTMEFQEVDTLVAAAIGALAAIFVGAFIGLLFICRRQHQKKNWQKLENSSANSLKASKKKRQETELAMAMNDIGLGCAMEQILNDECWVNDASGLVPYCLDVLRTCHSLTENLATLAMSPAIKNAAERLKEAAKRIISRVDDFVQSMYPPLDARLLEARAAALVLSVGQMALLIQNVGVNETWINKSLEDMDNHLLILRNAAMSLDPKRSRANVLV